MRPETKPTPELCDAPCPGEQPGLAGSALRGAQDIQDLLDIVAETFRLLGDPTRLRILIACAEGPVAVSQLAERTGASPSLVSHHLRLLRAARLVRGIRHERFVHYELLDRHVAHVLADMIAHAREDLS